MPLQSYYKQLELVEKELLQDGESRNKLGNKIKQALQRKEMLNEHKYQKKLDLDHYLLLTQLTRELALNEKEMRLKLKPLINT